VCARATSVSKHFNETRLFEFIILFFCQIKNNFKIVIKTENNKKKWMENNKKKYVREIWDYFLFLLPLWPPTASTIFAAITFQQCQCRCRFDKTSQRIKAEIKCIDNSYHAKQKKA
jgi:hypothetical protein